MFELCAADDRCRSSDKVRKWINARTNLCPRISRLHSELARSIFAELLEPQWPLRVRLKRERDKSLEEGRMQVRNVSSDGNSSDEAGNSVLRASAEVGVM